jgi:hypothetical protein
MEKTLEGPYGEWCIVCVPEWCPSGMAIASFDKGEWSLDTGEIVTKYVKDWKLTPIFVYQ